jgi:hypothetical protein
MKSLTLRSALPMAVAAAFFAGSVAAGEVVIHKQPNFTGGALTLRNDSGNLTSSGFQDQASSIEVKSGRWQFCSQPDFKGDCVTLEQGKYATLDQKLNHRVESVRELPAVAQKKEQPTLADNAAARRDYRAEQAARQRELEERYQREREYDEYARARDREARYERAPERYSQERYSEERYTYPGSRW